MNLFRLLRSVRRCRPAARHSCGGVKKPAGNEPTQQEFRQEFTMSRHRLLIAEDGPERTLARCVGAACPKALLRAVSTRRLLRGGLRVARFDCAVVSAALAAGLREDEMRGTPVIVVGDTDDQALMVDCLRRGASDFLSAAEARSGDALGRRVRAAIERARAARQDRRRAARRELALRRDAETDALTGLYNRRFAARVLHSDRVRRDRRSYTACVMLDIDHFKEVNDRLGHSAGDAVLARVGTLLRRHSGGTDLPVRWGGEEFLVVRASPSPAEAWSWAERLRERFAANVMRIGGDRVRLTVSAGVALVPTRELCEHSVTLADQALYVAKEHGRDRVCTVEMARALESAEGCVAGRAERAGGRVRRFLSLMDLGPVQREHADGHAQRVSNLSAGLARVLKMHVDDAAAVEHAALVHDLGKVAVSESLLARPGPLSPAELAFVGEHSRFSGDLSAVMGMPPPVVDVVACRNHHGGTLPEPARVLVVADAYDAMVSGRPHAPGRSPAEALAELRRRRGTQFDPDAVDAMHFVDTQSGLAA